MKKLETKRTDVFYVILTGAHENRKYIRKGFTKACPYTNSLFLAQKFKTQQFAQNFLNNLPKNQRPKNSVIRQVERCFILK